MKTVTVKIDVDTNNDNTATAAVENLLSQIRQASTYDYADVSNARVTKVRDTK